MLQADFDSDQPLAKIRKSAAAACGALSTMSRFLSPAIVTVSDLQALRVLDPDRAYQDKYIVPLTAKEVSPPVRFAAITLLSSLHNPASTAILMGMLAEPARPDSAWVLWQAISVCADKKMLPVLIGLMEADDDPQVEEMLQYTMLRLAESGPDQAKDAGWWRIWYHRNQNRVAEWKDTPIPYLQKHLTPAPSVPIHRRKLIWKDLNSKAGTGYWIVSPGFLANAAASPARLGLITVLCLRSTLDETAEYWQKAQKLALLDGYLVAVVGVDADIKGKAGLAALTSDLNAAATECEKLLHIDHSRMFLQGIGGAGMAVIAAATVSSLPYRGYWTIDSPFRSADLPQLSAIKGKQFYLQGRTGDKIAPMWQINAGASILKKQGAEVQSAEAAGDGIYAYAGDPYRPITAALQWLEQGTARRQ